MKKRIATLTLTLITMMVLLSGCGWSTDDKTAVDSESSPFVSISSDIVYGQHVEEDSRIFVYDKYTKVVYYLFSNYNYDVLEDDHTFTYFSQYVNENGKYCTYDPETNTVSEIN